MSVEKHWAENSSVTYGGKNENEEIETKISFHPDVMWKRNFPSVADYAILILKWDLFEFVRLCKKRIRKNH